MRSQNVYSHLARKKILTSSLVTKISITNKRQMDISCFPVILCKEHTSLR